VSTHLRIVQEEPWRRRAACRDMGTDVFFPAGRSGRSPGMVKEARKVCARCVSKPACLAYALEWNIREGVWGGLTDKQRQNMRRDLKVAS
jgi:WhiB family redox-sensing transcriptional regulator